MKAAKVVARVQYVECPACARHLEGIVGDPRGASRASGDPLICDDCGVVFEVPNDVLVELS